MKQWLVHVHIQRQKKQPPPSSPNKFPPSPPAEKSQKWLPKRFNLLHGNSESQEGESSLLSKSLEAGSVGFGLGGW